MAQNIWELWFWVTVAAKAYLVLAICSKKLNGAGDLLQETERSEGIAHTRSSRLRTNAFASSAMKAADEPRGSMYPIIRYLGVG